MQVPRRQRNADRSAEKHTAKSALGEMDYLLESPDDRAGALAKESTSDLAQIEPLIVFQHVYPFQIQLYL